MVLWACFERMFFFFLTSQWTAPWIAKRFLIVLRAEGEWGWGCCLQKAASRQRTDARSPRISFFHLIFYDTFGNYCHLRLSSMKRAMSSSADRRGFVVVWFYYLSSAIRLHAVYVSQSILHHLFSVQCTLKADMFKSYKLWRNSTSIGIDLCLEI